MSSQMSNDLKGLMSSKNGQHEADSGYPAENSDTKALGVSKIETSHPKKKTDAKHPSASKTVNTSRGVYDVLKVNPDRHIKKQKKENSDRSKATEKKIPTKPFSVSKSEGTFDILEKNPVASNTVIKCSSVPENVNKSDGTYDIFEENSDRHKKIKKKENSDQSKATEKGGLNKSEGTFDILAENRSASKNPHHTIHPSGETKSEGKYDILVKNLDQTKATEVGHSTKPSGENNIAISQSVSEPTPHL